MSVLGSADRLRNDAVFDPFMSHTSAILDWASLNVRQLSLP